MNILICTDNNNTAISTIAIIIIRITTLFFQANIEEMVLKAEIFIELKRLKTIQFK